MKQRLFETAIFMAWLGCLAHGAETHAVPPAAPAVTVDALVADVLENNPERKFYEAEILAAKAGRRTAGQFANPELSGSVGAKSVRSGGLSAEGVAWSASVMQPFEWPGRIGLRKAIANRDIDLAHLGYERFKLALGGRVRTLGFALFAAQEKATAAQAIADRFRELREVLVQRDPSGLTPLLETRVIEATEMTMQRKATAARLDREKALLELNQLRGVDAGTPLLVREMPLSFRPGEDLQVLQALAHTNNFELRLRATELAQQGLRVDLARNERFPTLAVGPTISEERAGDRERIIGVGVSLPLPLWNWNRGNIDAAAARQTQAEVALQVAEREVQRKVAETALTYQAKVGEMSQWRPDSVEHFREAAETADRHYRLGAVPVATYVELQKQYLEAVEGLLDTKTEALGAAQDLELLTGLKLLLVTTKEETK